MESRLLSRRRLLTVVFELILVTFLLGLVIIVVSPPRAASAGTGGAVEPGPPSPTLAAYQGTPLVTTVSGTIDGTEPTFNTQRHFRSGLVGDRNCQRFGNIGPRFFDEVLFFNSSSTPQKISIGFVSSCGNNTYMAAYNSSFDPADICSNFIAGPGVSNTIDWEFTVCANSQFSIVVYRLEPGLLCGGYSYTVFGSGVSLIGPSASAGALAPPAKVIPPQETPARSDVKAGKTKSKLKRAAALRRINKPIGGSLASLVPQGGTPLVALITDAIDGTEPKFVNQRHLESLIAGNRNCGVVRPVSSGVQPVENHFYDEYFFFNSSSTSETVLVGFNPSCSVVAFTAAYAPGFDPNNICENFIASQGFAGPRNWEFTVCAGSRFSIVVYNHRADTACPSYVLEVFGNNMTFLGTVDDLAVSKTVASRSGSAVNYNITVTNNGPNPARNFTIVDPLPAGTTFLSLNPGGASCTTPPVGAGGTVSCSVPLLAAPGTNLPTSLTILLSLTITPQAGALVTNTVTVSRFGIDPNPSNNTASSVVATSCLQDDATGSVLSIDVGTGDYQFSNCHGVTITGRGIVKVKGCMITLQHFGIDRRVQAHIDTCQKRGTGLVQIVSTGVTFPLTDRNTVNNTCVCTGG